MFPWKLFLILHSLIEFSLEAKQNSSSLYSIVAHGKLVPHSVYSIVVDIAGEINETEVSAVIYGKTDENETVSINNSASVKHCGVTIIGLKIHNLTDGEYSLNISAIGGLQFKHHTRLNLQNKRLSIFVQTDKAAYKPGQTVRFRVVAVHQNLLPAFSEKVQTEIHDSNGNLIQAFNEEIKENGIMVQEFRLSEEPVLGDWQIYGSIGNQKFSKTFQVAEYVLPLFDVQISAPSNLNSNKTLIPIEVKAIYTYGKPVTGTMKLSIFPTYSNPNQPLYEVYSSIRGEKTIAVQMKHIVSKKIYYSTSFDVSVSVNDSLTRKVYNKSHQIEIYENELYFHILNQNTNFRYGMDYTLYLKGVDRKDQIIKANNTPVNVYFGFGYDNYDKKIETKITDGIINVVIDTNPPPFETINVTTIDGDTVKVYHYSDNSSIGIQVEYQNRNFTSGSLFLDRSLDDCFAQLRTEKMIRSFEVGEQLNLIFDSNIPIKRYIYQIVSKDGIIFSKNVSKTEASKKHAIKLNTTHEMTPKARIVVYFMCNKSIAVDAIEFKVNGILRTKVNISAESSAKPASNVTITFNSNVPSSVHILAIDKKMLLLKSGNDIEMKSVIEETEKYVGCDEQNDFGSCIPNRWYYSYLRGNGFTSSGLHVFSSIYNDIEHEIHPIRKRKFGMVAAPAPLMSMEYSDTYTTTASAGRAMSYRDSQHKTPAISVRQNFPETWLWETLQTDINGKISITRAIPDTITSWIITCFATNNVTGFGVTDQSRSIKVSRKFFVNLNLPYSIIRGETVTIEATIYNYHKKAKNVEVSLEKNNGFVYNISEQQNNLWDSKSSQTKSIIVPANNGVTVQFRITAIKLGFIDVQVTAVNDGNGDSVSEKLFVKPEGETFHINHGTLISLNHKSNRFFKNFQVEIPTNAVKGSKRISFSVIADILGNVVKNIDKLLQVPCGCGEQNMVNFVPNVVVLEYLTNSKKLTKKLKVKALTNIQTGYQRQLKYEHRDGSFSAFGVGDMKGSTWLTAFVLKSFVQAKSFVQIDTNVVERSIIFLLDQQSTDGSFLEHGTVINKAMQSGTADGKGSLSAYVIIALTLQQNKNSSLKVSEGLNIGLDYLSNILLNSTDIYEIAIISYALHLNDHKDKNSAFKKLIEVANKTDDYTHWSRNGSKGEDYTDIEITSYALQTLLLRNETELALSVVRWLISKQNCYGGFSNTQNTVIAIESLAKFASNFSTDNVRLNINIDGNKDASTSLEVNKEDAGILREVLLSKNTKSINVTASGVGTAVMQVSWKYNLMLSKTSGFAVHHSFVDKLNTSFKMKICVNDTQHNKNSGMVLIETLLPSGFIADTEWLSTIRSKNVKRTETRQENTEIIVYFDELPDKRACVVIAANRRAIVENAKPAPITVYDYYNNSKKTTVFYTL